MKDKTDDWDWEQCQKYGLALMPEDIGTAQSVLRRAAKALTTLQAELDDTRKRLAMTGMMGGELVAIVTERNNLRTQLDEARAAAKSWEKDFDIESDHVERLQKELDEARRKITFLEDQFRHAEAQLTKSKQEMLRESLEDCVAVIRGALSGPVQVASVLKKADSVLYSTSESKKGN